MSPPVPKVIRRSDPLRIEVDWSDGHRSVFPAAELRRRCPCAGCVSEVTGRRILDPSSIPDDLRQDDVRLVGNYAIAVRFSDGHETGIFAYSFLRRLDPSADA